MEQDLECYSLMCFDEKKICAPTEAAVADLRRAHLNGPNAIRHMDKLLQYPNLNGIQWVYGAGQPSARHWISLLQKIQNVGKLVQVNCEMDDVLPLCRALRPEGVHLIVHGCPDVDTGKELLRAAEEATREGVVSNG